MPFLVEQIITGEQSVVIVPTIRPDTVVVFFDLEDKRISQATLIWLCCKFKMVKGRSVEIKFTV